MGAPRSAVRRIQRSGTDLRARLQQAFSEFLGVPAVIILGFLVLAAGMYLLDQADIAVLQPVDSFMQQHVMGDVAVTRGLLGAIATSLITVTSITFSILLLAVQQSASSLTSQVFDQFLRRPLNQMFFGFFVGTTLYTFIILATVKAPFVPVLGATLALVLTGIALCLLILLFYVTIDQMRPNVIIEAIHNHVLTARQRQVKFLQRVRTAPLLEAAPERALVRAESSGFIFQVNLDAIKAAVDRAHTNVEIVLLGSIGSYVAFEDPTAEIRHQATDDVEGISEAVRAAILIQPRRDTRLDPAFGIEQLETIGWTSISPAKSNQAPGIFTTRVLRDLLAHWAASQDTDDSTSGQRDVPVVYRDNVLERLMSAFEALLVVAATSNQHRIVAEIASAYSVTFARLSEEQRQRAEAVILRLVTTLDGYVMTSDLDSALADLERTLVAFGRKSTAITLGQARAKMTSSIGEVQRKIAHQSGR